MVTPNDVLAYLGVSGAGEDEVAQIQAHIATAKAMVQAYTRGRGFTDGEPDDSLSAVIVSCAARSSSNPTMTRTQRIDDYQESPGLFNGWTLPELAILNNYRVRAR